MSPLCTELNSELKTASTVLWSRFYKLSHSHRKRLTLKSQITFNKSPSFNYRVRH